jgi:hypothetical protein
VLPSGLRSPTDALPRNRAAPIRLVLTYSFAVSDSGIRRKNRLRVNTSAHLDSTPKLEELPATGTLRLRGRNGEKGLKARLSTFS